MIYVGGRPVKRLYISGPITGNPYYEIHFETAAYKLREVGYDVFNPAAVHLPDREADASWEAYMRRDLALIMRRDPDGIALLEGWENSEGSTLEVQIAKIYGIPVKPLHTWLDLGETTRNWNRNETALGSPESFAEQMAQKSLDALNNKYPTPSTMLTIDCNHFWLSTETRDGIQQECVDCGTVNLERNPT